MSDKEPRGDLTLYMPALSGEVSCVHGISNAQVVTMIWCSTHSSCLTYDCPTCSLDNHIPVQWAIPVHSEQPQTIVSRAKELE